MPKAEKFSMKRRAVLARERREREKEEKEYNATLKEFLQFKYNHIIAEFNPFYENLMTRRPANMIYTNTNEFRLWRKREIKKGFSPSNEREELQQNEQLSEQQQDEQLPELQQNEQLLEQQQDGQLPEQQQDEQLPEQQQDGQLPEQQQDGQLPELPLEQQQNKQQSELQQNEQLPEQQQDGQLPELGQLVNELVGEVDEIMDGHDEGIALDIWEELQGDIEGFDYRLEVELDQYMQ